MAKSDEITEREWIREIIWNRKLAEGLEVFQVCPHFCNIFSDNNGIDALKDACIFNNCL